MTNSHPLLHLENVTKCYQAPDGRDVAPVLNDITLTIHAGESIAITGPSGSGKSTLLNVIGCLDSPSSGTITLAGRDVSNLSQDQLAQVRNQEVGFVFQQHHLLPQLTVLENVMAPCLMKQSNSERQASEIRACHLLDRVGLKDRITYWPGQLSGGERQRVAVVRAMINQPKLLLADEPTGSLDRTSSEDMARFLIELNQQEGITLLVVTHSMDIAKRMNKIFDLRDANLVALD
jgi:ABC-type lipoprotein export system ATPase subunit